MPPRAANKVPRNIGEAKRSPGRPKGTPNKTTAAIKDAILAAFDEVGGARYLKTVATDDPRTFCALLGKVLPTQVSGDLTLEAGDSIKALMEAVNGQTRSK